MVRNAGWQKESHRHALAARGIKTNQYFANKSYAELVAKYPDAFVQEGQPEIPSTGLTSAEYEAQLEKQIAQTEAEIAAQPIQSAKEIAKFGLRHPVTLARNALALRKEAQDAKKVVEAAEAQAAIDLAQAQAPPQVVPAQPILFQPPVETLSVQPVVEQVNPALAQLEADKAELARLQAMSNEQPQQRAYNAIKTNEAGERTMELDTRTLARLKMAYANAKKEGKPEFEFDDHAFNTQYAKYLIEYGEMMHEKDVYRASKHTTKSYGIFDSKDELLQGGYSDKSDAQSDQHSKFFKEGNHIKTKVHQYKQESGARW